MHVIYYVCILFEGTKNIYIVIFLIFIFLYLQQHLLRRQITLLPHKFP